MSRQHQVGIPFLLRRGAVHRNNREAFERRGSSPVEEMNQ